MFLCSGTSPEIVARDGLSVFGGLSPGASLHPEKGLRGSLVCCLFFFLQSLSLGHQKKLRGKASLVFCGLSPGA